MFVSTTYENFSKIWMMKKKFSFFVRNINVQRIVINFRNWIFYSWISWNQENFLFLLMQKFGKRRWLLFFQKLKWYFQFLSFFCSLVILFLISAKKKHPNLRNIRRKWNVSWYYATPSPHFCKGNKTKWWNCCFFMVPSFFSLNLSKRNGRFCIFNLSKKKRRKPFFPKFFFTPENILVFEEEKTYHGA